MRTKKPISRGKPKTHPNFRSRRKGANYHVAFFLIILGISLLSLWTIHRFFYNRSLALSSALLASYASQPTTTPLPIHISIGTTISLPVVEAGLLPNGTWTVSNTSANHVRESASPGGGGNIIIYAHNTGNLFGKLEDVKIGDIISVRTTDAVLHTYKVSSTQWVTPGHTELLAPTSTETLTLYTCAGLLDSLRIVVRALPVK